MRKSLECLDAFKHGLIVSCQVHAGHPLQDPSSISALALCAVQGGAVGIRADGPKNVTAIKENVSVPVISIHKVEIGADRPSITPTLDHATQLARVGADLIALEATCQNQPDVMRLEELIRSVRSDLQLPVMADVSIFEEGLRAWEMGADLVATTLSGYTPQSPPREDPDFELVGELAEAGIRVVAEGRIRTPEQVGEMFRRGAHAVVVGTAITDPVEITSWFVDGARKAGL